MKSCFFIGHRETSDELFAVLLQTIERHIAAYGVTEFVVGNYGNFDHMAARAVAKARELHSEIKLILLLAYHPAERNATLRECFDQSFYPPGMEKVPRQLAIVRANQYMVDHVDFLISYVWHPASNAKKLIEYAQKREKCGLLRVENLAANIGQDCMK